MYVIVQHTVNDPESFFADVPSVAMNAPAGVHARQFFPSEDRTAAVCLWEADSVDAVRAYIDQVAGGAAENRYYEVSKALALGLPEAVSAGT